MTGQRNDALLYELRGKPGKATIEVPPLPPGPVLVEAHLAEDKTFTVKAPGLRGSFGKPPEERGVAAERELWCTAGDAQSVKVKAKTTWILRFHAPSAATALGDALVGVGGDVVAYHGPEATLRLVSHHHADPFLNRLIDDVSAAAVTLTLPPGATDPDQVEIAVPRYTSDRDVRYTLTGPCLLQVSALPWCDWTATISAP